FFFQAEDGIRDRNVTGVQTCALPIWFGLTDTVAPFRRCLRCNDVLEPVSKEDVLDRLEPKTKLYYDKFAICRACDRVYWKGSHRSEERRVGKECRDGRARE